MVRRPSLGTALGATALFVALGGRSYAADLVASAARTINGATIRSGTITGKQIKNGSVAPVDLSRAARAGLVGAAGARGLPGARGVPGATGATGATGPSVPTALADGSVGTEKLADGAVSSAKVAAGAVTASKLGAGSVEAAKLATGAVTTSALADGGIGGADLGAHGGVLVNVTSVAALSCSTVPFTAPGNIGSHSISVVADNATAQGNLTFTPLINLLGANTGLVFLRICNATSLASGTTSVGFRWQVYG